MLTLLPFLCRTRSQVPPLSLTRSSSSPSTPLQTEFDMTGQIVWPVSILASWYLVSVGETLLRPSKKAIELGAGCGLCGFVASHFLEDVVITDGEPTVTDIIRGNASHADPKCRVRVRRRDIESGRVETWVVSLASF
jgi:hypothetical protein